jgi:hypothetical protein
MTDFILHPTGQYHKVGTAGRLSLYTAKDNIGTHWLVTLDEKVFDQNYWNRPSIKGLRKAIEEWKECDARSSKPLGMCPFDLPDGTPNAWKRYENPAASFNGY